MAIILPVYLSLLAASLSAAAAVAPFNFNDFSSASGSGNFPFPGDYDNFKIIPIGALIPRSAEPTGNSEWDAFAFAVEDVNNDPNVLPNALLVPQSIDTYGDTWEGFEGAVKLNGERAVAVVGPGLSTVARVVSPLATRVKVPFVTPTATSLALSLHEVHRYVLQLCPSSRLESEIMVDIISHFGWSYVAVVRSEDEYGRSSLLEFESLAYAKGINVIDTVEVPASTGAISSGDDEETEIVNRMEASLKNLQILKTRIFVLSVQDSQLIYVFKAAKRLHLVGPEFVWIVNGVDSPAEMLSTELLDLMKGSISTSTAIPDRAVKWQKLHPSLNTTSAYELYTYDAVWLIARGLDRFIREKNDFTWLQLPTVPGAPRLAQLEKGDVLLDYIRNVTFEGVSGDVAFDAETGERAKAYNIINMYNSTFQLVGKWSPGGETVDKRLDLSNRYPSITFYNSSNVPPPDRDNALNQTIYVLTIDSPPYATFVPNNNNKENQYSGYAIDLLKQLSKDIGFRYELEKWNGTYNELIYHIASPNNRHTMAAADVTITTKREALVDFTTSYHTSGLGVMILRPGLRAKAGMWGFLAPFDYGVWLLLFAFFVFGAIVLFLTESNRAYHPALKFGEALWISFSAFFGTHKDDKVTSLPGRAWLLVMLLSLLVINAAYTAVLTTFLLSKEITVPFSQVDDLINVPVGALPGSTNFIYVERKLNNVLEVHTNKSVKYLEEKTIEAYVSDKPTLLYTALTNCSVYTTDIEFQRQQLGFPMQRGSALLEPISERIQSYWESGLLSQLYNRHFVWASKCDSGSEVSEVDTIKLTEIAGIFVVLGVTTVVCVGGNFLKNRFFKNKTCIDDCCIGEDPEEFYARAMEMEEVNKGSEYKNGDIPMKERPAS
ncbi:uncharacterized protein [Oscarella lobularis]|uniref:uncharacterized protein n=1 Tax=Oscarella lobularis TaxID=121494 RepID=UPI00331377B4